jgi:hypothetical protein
VLAGRRAGEGALLDHGDQVPELVQFHNRSLWRRPAGPRRSGV